MTKEEVIIRNTSTPTLLKELEELLELALVEEWESIQTLEDVFEDTFNKADTIKEWKPFRTPCRRVAIALGWFVPMTQEEIDMTVTNRGSVWDFKFDGVPYKTS
jgi:hypothetical protein